jgi:hypothetical protein
MAIARTPDAKLKKISRWGDTHASNQRGILDSTAQMLCEGESLQSLADLLGVGEGVSAAVVGDGDVALLNVNVGRAILTHRPQLHQVAVGLELLCTNIQKAPHHLSLRQSCQQAHTCPN